MTTTRCAMLILSILLWTTAAGARPLPPQDVPQGLRAIDESRGGRILYGELTRPGSTGNAFKAGLRSIRGYFGDSLTLTGVIRGKDGATTMGTFRAAVDGVAVSGLVMTAYSEAGASRVGALFDTPDRFPKTAGQMQADLASAWDREADASRPASGPSIDFRSYLAASKRVSLTTLSSPDGTATIGIAPDYRAQEFTSAAFAATAADGAYIHLNIPVSVYTPDGSYARQARQFAAMSHGRIKPVGLQIFAPYDPDPATAWKNMLTASAEAQNVEDPRPRIQFHGPVHSGAAGQRYGQSAGTITINGQPFLFLANPITSPPAPNGFWFMTLTVIACPLDKGASDMPALIAMQRSLHVNQSALAAKTAAAIKASWAETNAFVAASTNERNRSFEQSMRLQRQHEDSMSRATAGMIRYVYGDTVVRYNDTGEHYNAGIDYAGALVKADPQHFSQVPLNEYVKGVDY